MKTITELTFTFQAILHELEQGDFSRIHELWQAGTALTTFSLQSNQLAQAQSYLHVMRRYAPHLTELDPDTEMARLEFRMSMLAQMQGDEKEFDAHTESALTLARRVFADDAPGRTPPLYFHINGAHARSLARRAVNRILPLFHEVGARFSAIPSPSREVVTAYVQFCHNACEGLLKSKLLEQGLTVANEALALLSALPQDDLALDLTAQLCSVVGTAHFYAQSRDEAVAFLARAVDCTERMTEMPVAQKAKRLAKYGFDCANALFQSDRDDEAIPYFTRVIDTCTSVFFVGRENILRYAADYYAQLLVKRHDYKAAVGQYEGFLAFAKENAMQNDFLHRTCANFSYRIAYVYAYFLCNAQKIEEFLARAKDYLARIDAPQQTDLALQALIEEGF